MENDLRKLVPIFSLPETYTDAQIPLLGNQTRYKRSQFTSFGKRLIGSNFCDYYSFSQTLGSATTSLAKIVNENDPELVELLAPTKTHRIKWRLVALFPPEEGVVPDLRVVIRDTSQVNYEAFDVYGERIRFNTPDGLGASTCGCFTLPGYYSQFQIYSNVSYLQVTLDIKVIEESPLNFNPYLLKKYCVQVGCQNVPCFEVVPDPEKAAHFRRVVFPGFRQLAHKAREEFLSRVYVNCLEVASLRTVSEEYGTMTLTLRPDVRTLKEREKDCITEIISAVLGAIILIGGIAGLGALVAETPIAAAVNLLSEEISSTLVFEDGVAVFVFPGALLGATQTASANSIQGLPKRSPDTIESGQVRFGRLLPETPNFCLFCGLSLYVDLAHITYEVERNKRQLVENYDVGTRSFNIRRAGLIRVTVNIKLNYNRRLGRGEQGLFVVGEPYCFFRTVLPDGTIFVEDGRPYFMMVGGALKRPLINEIPQTVPVDNRVRGLENRVATKLNDTRSVPGSNYDYQLFQEYIINHNGSNDSLYLQLYNGAALLKEGNANAGLTFNMTSRDVGADGSLLEPSLFTVTMEPIT